MIKGRILWIAVSIAPFAVAGCGDGGGGDQDVVETVDGAEIPDGNDAIVADADADVGPDADAEAEPDSPPGDPGSICSPVPVTADLTSPPLPPPPAPGPELSFVSNWATNPVSGGWQRTQVMDSCRIQPDGTTWHGFTAARVEVRPGDDPLALGSNSERAEVLGLQTDMGTSIYENSSSGTQYYAMSYYFPASWDGTFLSGDEYSWSIVFQVHDQFAMSAGRRTDGGAQMYRLTGIGGGPGFEMIDVGEIALGRWTDLVLMVRWSTAADGQITLWRRDEGEAQFIQIVDDTRVTLGVSDPSRFYWKQGLYRGGHVEGRVDVLWMGPFARGTSFSAVEQAAFGTNDGHP